VDAVTGLLLLLKALPIVGAIVGGMTNHIIGLVVGLSMMSAVSLVVVAVASILAARRVPIHLVVIPDPQAINRQTSAVWLRTAQAYKSEVGSAALWARLQANNFGSRDLRISGLMAEFQTLWLGLFPRTFAKARCSRLPPQGDVNWLLPAVGSLDTRLAHFIDAVKVRKIRLAPGDTIIVRVRVEVGAPGRSLYVAVNGDYEVWPPL